MLPSSTPAVDSGDDPASSLPSRFAQLQEAVLSKRPILREIIKKRGHKKLYEYAQEYISVYLNPPIQRRQDECIETIRIEVEQRLGSAVAQGVAEQLRKYYFVSTTDHHGPICNQSFVNANLMVSTPYLEQHDPLLQYVIVLACANVSLNNITFPRGLIFNTFSQDKIQLQRLSFLPSNAHASAVYNFRSYQPVEIEKMKKLLAEKQRQQLVTKSAAEKIIQLLDDIYNQPELFDCSTYADQIVQTNFQLWNQFFSSSGTKPTHLIYLAQEEIVAKLLVQYHLFEDTTIHHWLFDHDYDLLLDSYFDGIMGAFSKVDGVGTYLFWGISSDKNYRVRLWKHGDRLVSADGSVSFALTPAGLATVLANKTIIPSLLTVFTVLCFYYGLKCLGGFNQVNYLTQMKNAYIKMMTDRGNYKSIEVCARAQTKEMNDGFLLAFAGAPNGDIVPAAGLDLILYGQPNTWEQIMTEAKNITLAEALNPSLPEFYRFVYPEANRLPELAAITTEQVSQLTGLDKKIKPCVMITA
ncbi:MAG: hypothetical protein HYV33_03070 [Candidatus Kerfeldbacteria bacterium]|nr:hypothetical protein [Candidatus Kerfeldbacteria bacterium]